MINILKIWIKKINILLSTIVHLSLSFLNYYLLYIIFLIFSFIYLYFQLWYGIILISTSLCFFNISRYLIFIFLVKPSFSSRIFLCAHLVFLRCLLPFIRTKRRFVGFSSETVFSRWRRPNFSCFCFRASSPASKKACRYTAAAGGKIVAITLAFRGKSRLLLRDSCLFSCHSTEKRECGQRNNNTRVLLTH